MEKTSRRNYMKSAMLSVGALAMGVKALGASDCFLTPEQTEGPFYPDKEAKDKDHDLTFVKGSRERALGEVVIIKGVVRDYPCAPIENAVVEIWQACATGRYNHSGDPNPAELDPNFQYWGRAITNNEGEYSFKTVRPGHYRATNRWMRPSHIHLKVYRRGYEELTTQVYFKGDPYNENDRILQSLSEEEQRRVVVDFRHPTDEGGELIEGPKVGKFDISIRVL